MILQKTVNAIYDGVNEGVDQVNGAVDDAIYSTPDEQADAEVSAQAEKLAAEEADAEEAKADSINDRIDSGVQDAKANVDKFNQSFSKGVQIADQKIKDAGKSDIATAYRAARLVYWGNLAKNYIASHPDWASSLRQNLGTFAKNASSKLYEMGTQADTSQVADTASDTDEICARRDAMFGSADAGIEVQPVPDTELMLQGVEIPVADTVAEVAMG